VFASDCKQQKFTTRHAIQKPTDLFALEDDTIKRIASQPIEAELLIKELLYEYKMTHETAQYCWNQLEEKKK